MNVLFLNSWYPNEISHLNGNFIQQHARAVSLYCKVSCLNIQGRNQSEDFEIVKQWKKNVFEVIVYYKSVESKSFYSILRKRKKTQVAYLKGFHEIIKEFKSINIVHLNVIFPAGIFALHLKKKYNLQFIVTEHSTMFLDANPNKHSWIEKYFIVKIAQKASVLCPVSEDLKFAMINNGLKGKYEVIPNVVDPSFSYKTNKNNGIIKLLHISSLKQEHKNIYGILDVINQLSKIRNDFHLTIVGDINLDVAIAYSLKIKLNSTFLSFFGVKAPVEIANIMQSNDLFILFSNYENLPCVISEALVSGLPVISSNVGGIKEMISQENGVLVEPKNQQQLLKELNNIMNNLNNYDRNKIAKHAIKRYSYEVVGKHFFDIYKDVVG